MTTEKNYKELADQAVRKYGLNQEITETLVKNMLEEGRSKNEVMETVRAMYRAGAKAHNEKVLSSLPEGLADAIRNTVDYSDGIITEIEVVPPGEDTGQDKREIEYFLTVRDAAKHIRTDIDQKIHMIQNRHVTPDCNFDTVMSSVQMLAGLVAGYGMYAQVYGIDQSDIIKKFIDECKQYVDRIFDFLKGTSRH